MSDPIMAAISLLRKMSDANKLPMEQVAGVLCMKAEEDARINALRRSSEDEIEQIETGLDALFEKHPDTEMTTKELAREIRVSPRKQGNLARISRKAKMLRLAYQERLSSRKAA